MIYTILWIYHTFSEFHNITFSSALKALRNIWNNLNAVQLNAVKKEHALISTPKE